MLEVPVFAGLVVNAALLLALALFAGLIPRSVEPGAAAVRRTLTGLVVATFGVAVMLVPVALAPGLVFDVRSVLLSVAGMFFGIIPTAIGMLATAALRWSMGGVAAVPGIAVILASGAIGLLWRRIAKDRLHRIGAVELYGFGLVVHVTMVAILSTLPPPYAAQFWREAVAPVMLIYPVLTVIVGRLLAGRLAAERAVEALRASEARFRTLFEGGPAILLIVDPADGSVVDANPAAVAFYGWSLEELRRRRLDEIDTLPRGELLLALARARAQDARAAGAFRHRLADGSERDVEMISGPIERDGRPLLYALVVDVHERRRAEERQREDARRREQAQALAAERDRRGRLAALNLAEDAVRAQRQAAAALGRLQLLIDHAPAALAMFDRDLRFTTVSRRFVTDYGLEGVPLIGRHHYEVFPEIPEDLRAIHRRALAGEVARGDGTLDRGGGRIVHGRWEVRPWRDDRGEIGGMVLFTEDLSEERLAKEQLVKLSQAVEQSPLSIVITNPEAEIEYVNDAFVEATGYGREEVLGRNPRILNSGKTPAATYRDMWAALQAGRSWKGEFVNRRKDGSEYVEFATVSPIFAADGRPAHYLALKEDVTEKKRIGQELDRYRNHLEALVEERTRQLEAALERAEVANRAKSAFLANMSHEIRTPLNAVVGLTHLLLVEDPTPRQRDRLVKIDASAGHLLSIVSDVLDLAKIEAGKASLDEHDFHLSTVLDHVGSIVSGAAQAKGLSLEIDGHAVPVWLHGDAARLRQALLNLASNAVKFTERGSVRVTGELLEAAAGRLRVRFEVADTGIGIAPEVIPKLFGAFEQGDASITRAYGGSGLGLAVTRRLAELMGGDVGIDSTPGVGTRVWFTAVLRPGRGEAPAFDRAARADRATERARPLPAALVLVADDHPINREVAVELLHRFGVAVEAVENGREAVDRARERRYDAILMDVQMPELDGLQATRAIRALPGYERVPILAMTANAFEEDRRACLEAGMDDFVAKPVDPFALRATLEAWLTAAGARSSGPASEAPASGPPLDRGGDAVEPAPSSIDAACAALAQGGVDVELGVAALGGDHRQYLHLVRRLVDTHGATAQELRRELAAGDLAAARGRLHAVRGVAATLGVRRVAEVLVRLERPLRGDVAPDEATVAELERELGGLAEAVEAAGVGAAGVGAETVGADAVPDVALAEVLERLAAFLAVDDPDALGWTAAHIAGLRVAFGAEADRLADAVDRFDFAAARDLVDRLRASPHD